LASIEKELQQTKTDNTTMSHYINAKRKKKEDRRKMEVRKKAEEYQSSKCLFPSVS
jgi:uncharacterized membrane protein YgaE (UPF0421/DUF939 family)